jgi:restriction system protein
MGRRRKTSTADDIVEIVSWLPWWGGVLLAVVVWVLFEVFTPTLPSAAGLKPGQIPGFATQSLFAQLAPIFKYLFCFLCMLGALVSFIGRRKRQALLKDAQGPGGASAVHGMTWREFEMLVGEAFRQQGYAVAETGAAGPDGGVDLVLRKGAERYLVQCKQWRALKVGVSVVREHYGVMAAQGAVGGFVVTSGRFTREAESFAAGRNIQLIDGPRLQTMIETAQTRAPASAARAVTPQAEPPSCPKCQSTMVLRTAGKGANTGAQFWGCSRFPDCRGTRQA